MSIYRPNRINYRKIYEDFFGPIPVDKDGRSYEIHHIDGNVHNNDPSNLKAVSIQEHFDIHQSQGDWYACLLIGARLEISPKEKRVLASKHAKKLIAEGRHPFAGPSLQKRRVAEGTHPWQNKDWHSQREKEKVKQGTHLFLGGEMSRKVTAKRLEDGTHNFLGNTFMKDFWTNTDPKILKRYRDEASERQKQRVKDGTHHFLGSGEKARELSRKLLEEGKHHSQVTHICPHCNKTGRGATMFRHHFARCKLALVNSS